MQETLVSDEEKFITMFFFISGTISPCFRGKHGLDISEDMQISSSFKVRAPLVSIFLTIENHQTSKLYSRN